MKKFFLVCLILLLIGGVFLAAGVAGGGQIYGSYWGGRVHPVTELPDFTADSQWENHSGPIDTGDAAVSPNGLDIRSLDFSLAAGSFSIVSGDDYSVSGGWTSENKLQSGEWSLTAHGMPGETVVITVPQNIRYDEISIELGAGRLTADPVLSCRSLDIEVGAGDLSNALFAAQDVDISVGAGHFSGTLQGALSDYSYDAECGLGHIALDGNSLLSGIGEAARDSDGPNQLSMEVGMGALELSFKENSLDE